MSAMIREKEVVVAAAKNYYETRIVKGALQNTINAAAIRFVIFCRVNQIELSEIELKNGRVLNYTELLYYVLKGNRSTSHICRRHKELAEHLKKVINSSEIDYAKFLGIVLKCQDSRNRAIYKAVIKKWERDFHDGQLI